MVIDKFKCAVKGIFVKENKDYLTAEASASLASLVVATASSTLLSELGASVEVNSLLTYASKATAAILTNMAVYSYMHKKEEDPAGLETKMHRDHILKIGGKVGIVAGITKISLHYLLLAADMLSPWASTIVAYTIPGTFASYYRHKKNYEKGLLCINGLKEEKKEEKPVSIDQIVGRSDDYLPM